MLEELIEKYDKKHMGEKIGSFQLQIKNTLKREEEIKIISNNFKKKYKKIIVVGMGGSSISGHLLKAFPAKKIKAIVEIISGYDFDCIENDETLVFCISYSGNTEETLSIYNKILHFGLDICIISSGGKLQDLAARDQKPFISVPSGYPPRTALGYIFTTIFLVLKHLNLLNDDLIQEFQYIPCKLIALQNEIGLNAIHDNNRALILAKKLIGKIPIIYSPSEAFNGVAYRWKCQFCENSKILAFNNFFPELSHNEIVGFTRKTFLLNNFFPILLRIPDEHPNCSKTIEIIKEIFSAVSLPYDEISFHDGHLITNIFQFICFGDYTSYYLAILNGIDPTPIETINYMKKRLEEFIK